jgi:hypothetical protein
MKLSTAQVAAQLNAELNNIVKTKAFMYLHRHKNFRQIVDQAEQEITFISSPEIYLGDSKIVKRVLKREKYIINTEFSDEEKLQELHNLCVAENEKGERAFFTLTGENEITYYTYLYEAHNVNACLDEEFKGIYTF